MNLYINRLAAESLFYNHQTRAFSRSWIFSFVRHLLFIGHQPSKLKFSLDVDGVTLTVLLRWVASLSVSACHEEYPVTSHTSYQNKDLTQIVSLYIGFKSVSGNQTHSKYLYLYWLICTSWIYKFLCSENLTEVTCLIL